MVKGSARYAAACRRDRTTDPPALLQSRRRISSSVYVDRLCGESRVLHSLGKRASAIEFDLAGTVRMGWKTTGGLMIDRRRPSDTYSDERFFF